MNKAIYKRTALLLKSMPEQELAQRLKIELGGGKDVFDLLVIAGRAKDFYRAVELVADAFKDKTDKWSDLARWSLDYERNENEFTASIRSRKF